MCFTAQDTDLHLKRGIPLRNLIFHFYLKKYYKFVSTIHKWVILTERVEEKMQTSHLEISF